MYSDFAFSSSYGVKIGKTLWTGYQPPRLLPQVREPDFNPVFKRVFLLAIFITNFTRPFNSESDSRMFDLAFSADSIVRNPLLMIAHPPPSLGLDQITNINSSFSKRISHNEESVNVYFMIGQFIWRVAHISILRWVRQ